MIANEKFFNDLFKGNGICFRSIYYNQKNDPKKIPSTFGYITNDNTVTTLRQWNDINYETYFVVNSGGYENNEIHTINAVFIDLDIKDEIISELILNKSYPEKKAKKEARQILFDMSEQDRLPYIYRFISRVNTHDYKPTYIIRTKNGIQAYWLLQGEPTIKQFEICMERLVYHFKADTNAMRPCNLMRVPDFYHCKKPDDRFLVHIIEHNEITYDIFNLMDSLPPIAPSSADSHMEEGEGFSVYNKEYGTVSNYSGRKTPPTLQHIKTRNSNVMFNILKKEAMLFSTHDEVYDYLKTQDLAAYLGIQNPMSFRCVIPDHVDSNPSATILVNAENKHQVYYCRSCGYKNTIIGLTEKLTNYKNIKSLRFLRHCYNVHYNETEWQKDQKEKLYMNKRFLVSEDFKEYYPEVYNEVKKYIGILLVMIDFNMDNMQTEYFSDRNGDSVFFTQLDKIVKRLHMYNINNDDKEQQEIDANRSKSFINKRLSYLTFIGFINKLSEADTPELMLKEARHIAAKYKLGRLNNFYSVPSYDDNSMDYIQNQIDVFKANLFKKDTFSREMLLSLGEEEANRVFPQMKGEKVKESNTKLGLELEKTITRLIGDKGWTTKAEVLESCSIDESIVKKMRKHEMTEEDAKKRIYKIKERQFDKTLTELVSKYGLIQRPLNKKLKFELNITDSQVLGFPKIFQFSK